MHKQALLVVYNIIIFHCTKCAVCAACTIGEVGIPEPGDVPFQGGGVFLLPDPVPCSGQVQSWQGYGFFVPDDRVRNLTTRIFAAVFRPDDSEYKLVGM